MKLVPQDTLAYLVPREHKVRRPTWILSNLSLFGVVKRVSYNGHSEFLEKKFSKRLLRAFLFKD